MSNEKTYQNITASGNLNTALTDHFSYLSDSEEGISLLEKIMQKAQSVTLEDDTIIVHFEDDVELSCSEPSDTDFSNWPESYRRLMMHHEYISFPDDSGWSITLGDTESLEYSYIEEGDGELASIIQSQDSIFTPITDYSDWWIYHPVKKNPQGEPMLCMFSHESCDVEEMTDCNAGTLFIKKIAEYLDITVN